MVILKIKKGFSSGNWFCTSIPDIVDFGVKGQNVVKELEQVQLSVKNLFWDYIQHTMHSLTN